MLLVAKGVTAHLQLVYFGLRSPLRAHLLKLSISRRQRVGVLDAGGCLLCLDDPLSILFVVVIPEIKVSL